MFCVYRVDVKGSVSEPLDPCYAFNNATALPASSIEGSVRYEALEAFSRGRRNEGGVPEIFLEGLPSDLPRQSTCAAEALRERDRELFRAMAGESVEIEGVPLTTGERETLLRILAMNVREV